VLELELIGFYVYSGCCQLWNEHERRVASLEFDRDRKSMGVIVTSHSGKNSLLVKVFSLFSVCVCV
jgi:magnesium-transporting ATPase (P-type)